MCTTYYTLYNIYSTTVVCTRLGGFMKGSVLLLA